MPTLCSYPYVAGFVFATTAARAPVVGSNPYYFRHWCNNSDLQGKALEFLDDALCQKVFPPAESSSAPWRCPALYSAASTRNFKPDLPLSQVNVDTSAFSSIPTLNQAGVEAVIIAVRRSTDGVRYKYIGTAGHSQPLQPWSSTKIFAAMNAAGALREKSKGCAGLTANTTGRHGETPLGDLATIMCSYDATMNYTSNAIGSYWEDVGNRSRADWLVKDWLLNKSDMSHAQSFGGNYGEATPTDLGFRFSGGADCSCTVEPNHPTEVFNNQLSVLSLAELLRRLALHRDVPDAYRFPGAHWKDAAAVLTGAHPNNSALFPHPSVEWGGMAADTAIFVQSALGLTGPDSAAVHDSEGQWRIFSKLGAGYSGTRGVGEILTLAYACMPVLSADRSPVEDAGLEFILAARASVGGDSLLEGAQGRVKNAVASAIDWLKSARL